MAAKKKTVQETRKAYVQAKIATNSASKNPAKLRQQFNAKAATVKGRTEIAQVLGVAGTPQAQMLKATLRSFSTASTSGASTGATSTNKDKPVVTNKGYSPGIANNVNMPSNNAASSAVVPGAKITPPTTVPTSTTVPRSTTSTTVPTAQKSNNSGPKIVNFEPKGTPTVKVTKVRDNKNVYGDTFEEKIALKLEKYKVPIFGRVAGIGRSIDAGKNKEASLGLAKAVGLAAVTGGVSGTVKQVAGAVVGAVKTAKSIKNQNTNLQNEFRLSEALRYERTAENARTVRRDFGSVAEQRAANPPPGNKDFKFPSIKDQQKAYVYKPAKTKAGEPGTSGKNFSLDEYGRPVKLPKIK